MAHNAATVYAPPQYMQVVTYRPSRCEDMTLFGRGVLNMELVRNISRGTVKLTANGSDSVCLSVTHVRTTKRVINRASTTVFLRLFFVELRANTRQTVPT